MKRALSFLLLVVVPAFAEDLPKHKLPPSDSLVIGNCDGQGAVEIKGKKPGYKLSAQEAQAAADQLMQEWHRRNPNSNWTVAQQEKAPPPKNEIKADPVTAVGVAQAKKGGKQEITNQQGTYASFTSEDTKMWELEQNKLIKAGDELFHSSDKVGGTTGMACAMCHPNASNTHPETYPKFQVQLQRVAMLRDMINWCLENPIKAPMMKDDDPRMRALEAYIISQRRGKPLQPGRH
jgi:hypothetical protein